MHKDYFGNVIEVGDVVLRNCNSNTYVTKVLRITPKSIGIERKSWQTTNKRYDYNERKWIISTTNKPLYIQFYSIINLSKLDQSKIDETIKKYLNEL